MLDVFLLAFPGTATPAVPSRLVSPTEDLSALQRVAKTLTPLARPFELPKSAKREVAKAALAQVLGR
jgi:hypothetical protein